MSARNSLEAKRQRREERQRRDAARALLVSEEGEIDPEAPVTAIKPCRSCGKVRQVWMPAEWCTRCLEDTTEFQRFASMDIDALIKELEGGDS